MSRESAPRRVEGDARPSIMPTLGWTVLGTALPGLGLLGARRRRTAWTIFALALAVALVGVGLVVHDPTRAAQVLVSPAKLHLVAAITVVLALLMVVLVVLTHLAVRPKQLGGAHRALGAALVALLCFAVTAPAAVIARYAADQSELVSSVFAGDEGQSQTRPTVGAGQLASQVWADKDRINVLLAGIDDSAKRNYSQDAKENSDTMMVASIDIATGNTVIVQIPRNMQYARFPAGSPLAAAYPQGWGRDGSAADSMANAIWAGAPLAHPELFTGTDYPNADALKLALKGSLGIPVDYFVALDIDGLQKLIDAMGGVTVNINYPYAIGGDHTIGDSSVKGYLPVGANQHLDGYHAMWYARSRYNDPAGDFGRMARQTCLVNAVIGQANPATMLTRYEAIAGAGKQMVQTDIPETLLPAFVDLAMKVKGAKVSRLLFTNGKDGFVSADPDYALMQRRVASALGTLAVQPSIRATAPDASASPSPETQSPSPAASARVSSAPTHQESSASPSPLDEGAQASASASASPTAASQEQNLGAVCGYAPVPSPAPTPGR